MTTYKKPPRGAQAWLRSVIARATEAGESIADDGDLRAFVLGWLLGAAGIESNDPRDAISRPTAADAHSPEGAE